MYVPKHFEERNVEVLHALIETHPLATWVTRVDGALVVNHIPLLVDRSRGEYGMLVGHVARANPVWRTLSEDTESVAIFQGPECYITPSWYPSKQAHGKAVPTWNYVVVHAHGVARAIEDKDWLLQHVTAMSDAQEAARDEPWKVADAPSDYVDTMLNAIVGIEIPVSSIVGKWKTSQNRSLPDKLGTIAGLFERADESSLQMAALVEQHAARKEA